MRPRPDRDRARRPCGRPGWPRACARDGRHRSGGDVDRVVDAGAAELELSAGRPTAARDVVARPSREARTRSSRSSPRASTGSVCARRPSSPRRRARSPTSRRSAPRGLEAPIWPSGSPAGRCERARHATARAGPLRGDVRGRAHARRSTHPTRRRGTRDHARRCARHPGGRRVRRWRRAEAALALGHATRPANCSAPPRPRRRARRPTAAGADRGAGAARSGRARRRRGNDRRGRPRPHAARARGAAPRRRRPHQPRDRRRAVHEPQDASVHARASCASSTSGGRVEAAASPTAEGWSDHSATGISVRVRVPLTGELSQGAAGAQGRDHLSVLPAAGSRASR